jgi:hypothetical protein
MKLFTKTSLVILLAIGLIAILTVISPSMAQQQSNQTVDSMLVSNNVSAFSLGPEEQIMMRSIPFAPTANTNNITFTMNNLRIVKAQAEKDARKSIEAEAAKLFNNKSAIIPTFTIPSNGDLTTASKGTISPAYANTFRITTANAGNTGWSSNLAAIESHGELSDQSAKTVKSYALQWPSAGSFDSWAYVGSGFTFPGSGMLPVNIVPVGSWSEHTAAGLTASATTTLTIQLYDFTQQKWYSPVNIQVDTQTGAGLSDQSGPINAAMSTNLVRGDSYMVVVKTDSATSCAGIAGCDSDVSNWDGHNGYLSYSEIGIYY